jgi:hypothetical protein
MLLLVLLLSMARTNVTKANSTSSTSKVKTSRVSRRILLKSLLNVGPGHGHTQAPVRGHHYQQTQSLTRAHTRRNYT